MKTMTLSPTVKAEIKKVAIGALVAAAGAGLTYLSQVVTQVDLGAWTPLVTAVFSVLANVVRKLAVNTML